MLLIRRGPEPAPEEHGQFGFDDATIIPLADPQMRPVRDAVQKALDDRLDAACDTADETAVETADSGAPGAARDAADETASGDAAGAADPFIEIVRYIWGQTVDTESGSGKTIRHILVSHCESLEYPGQCGSSARAALNPRPKNLRPLFALARSDLPENIFERVDREVPENVQPVLRIDEETGVPKIHAPDIGNGEIVMPAYIDYALDYRRSPPASYIFGIGPGFPARDTRRDRDAEPAPTAE